MQSHLRRPTSEKGYYVDANTGVYLGDNPHEIERDRDTYFVEPTGRLDFVCDVCGYEGSRAHPVTVASAPVEEKQYACPNTECRARLRIKETVTSRERRAEQQIRLSASR